MARKLLSSQHLGDGVYVHDRGDGLMLAVNHHNNEVLFLEDSVILALISYVKDVELIPKTLNSTEDISDYHRDVDKQDNPKEKLYYHKTKDGRKIPLTDIKDDHLLSIIKFIERRSKNGLEVFTGGGSCAEEMWGDVDTYYGKEALDRMDYEIYKQELKCRNNDK